ncbi:MAG TPA: antitoxin MazE family protein [Eoetvoesiella sp.]|uniref:antitoxin MazE family protein n=1 Tax=Eoetvoesiella sp. TaxID=1966355 RepID=UPI002CA51938|nr:antitoxin MazE family protein [Eoetvoesiella sp.]HWK62352.1 antitoxin MazE family protein [Eoetvoesiella sp.]
MSDISTEKVTRHRARLRASGMRPIQLWVPDTRASDYIDRIKRQCLALHNDPAERDVLAFTEAAADDTEGWK